jgi:hypothetical protein
MSSGSNAVESGSNQARCSVKAIHDIISGFDERKKKIVESMGFIRLLKFPPIKCTNSAGKLLEQMRRGCSRGKMELSGYTTFLLVSISCHLNLI